MLITDLDVLSMKKNNLELMLMVMMKLALNAKNVSIVNIPLYHYIQTNTNSLTKNFSAYKEQVTFNAEEVARYVDNISRKDLISDVLQLKLSLKLPLLISDKKRDYEMWMAWFPEANIAVDNNVYLPWRTWFIQKMAVRRHFWILRLYYWLIIKVVYGIIYK